MPRAPKAPEGLKRRAATPKPKAPAAKPVVEAKVEVTEPTTTRRKASLKRGAKVYVVNDAYKVVEAEVSTDLGDGLTVFVSKSQNPRYIGAWRYGSTKVEAARKALAMIDAQVTKLEAEIVDLQKQRKTLQK